MPFEEDVVIVEPIQNPVNITSEEDKLVDSATYIMQGLLNLDKRTLRCSSLIENR